MSVPQSSYFIETGRSDPEQDQARKELDELLEQHGHTEPDRGNLDDPTITWRSKKPNYTMTNLAYFQGRTQNHAPRSLEFVVENLVKTYEMEISHKPDIKDWTTVDPEKYSICANGGKRYNLKENIACGNYNVMFDRCDKDLYDAKDHTFESSHQMMKDAFTGGFPWEVIKVFSPPPRVAFSWRHWGKFDGQYKDNKGKGDVIEIIGFVIAEVDEDLKVCSLEVYFDSEAFLKALSE